MKRCICFGLYCFLAGVACSYDWGWLLYLSGNALVADGWFVASARLVTVLAPFVVGVVSFANYYFDALAEAVHGH